MIPYRTGIDKDHIGLFYILRTSKTFFFQDSCNDLTVGKIHLAAIRLDKEFFIFHVTKVGN